MLNSLNLSFLQKDFFKKRGLFFKKTKIKKNFFLERTRLFINNYDSQEYSSNYPIYTEKDANITGGNFFFKRSFFKILIQNRRLFVSNFLPYKIIRQHKITKHIFNKKNNFLIVGDLLIMSQIVFFIKDVKHILFNWPILINNVYTTNSYLKVFSGDLIQLKINKKIFQYIIFSKRFFRLKLKLNATKNWKIFLKQKNFNTNKKVPKYYNMFCLFMIDIPRFIEFDYTVLTISILWVPKNLELIKLYLRSKQISNKLHILFNYKKVN